MNRLLFLIKFSLRSLKRSPTRTVIMMMSLALSTGFIIWALNFSESGSREVTSQFLKQYNGFYHIVHPEFYKEGNYRDFSIYKTITDNDIKSETELQTSTPRIQTYVFLSGLDKTSGVLLSGIDSLLEQKFTDLPNALSQGQFLNLTSPNQIMIGRRLAKKLKATIGTEIAAMGQGFDGSLSNDLFTVVGILDFGGGAMEERLAFTNIQDLRMFLGMPEGTYHERVSFAAKENLPIYKSLKTVPWTDLAPEVGLSMRFIDNFTRLISFIIVIVICIGLSNTLMITFLEREKEFTTLSIIGASGKWVMVMIMIEVLTIGVLSIALGLVAGHFATLYFFHHPLDIKLLTGGKPIMMGGLELHPLIKMYPVENFYWQVPLMVLFFLNLTFIFPFLKVLKRNEKPAI